MQKPKILIAESDTALRQNLKQQLLFCGYELTEALDYTSVMQVVRTCSPDLVILGAASDNDWKALEVAREIRRYSQGILLILIVENGSEDMVIAALRAGINDYFRKPFALDDLLTSINCCLIDKRCFTPPGSTESTSRNLIGCERLIGQSPSMLTIKSYLFRIAIADSTVLISGETGTGKELVAELIHKNSARNKNPFVCVNCAALPDSLVESELFGYERGAFTGAIALQRGKFELAHGGTVFLDEIGEMNPCAQAKILRTLESKEIYRLGGRKSIPLNMRIIAATNQDPERLVAEEKFRKDLYFRLNVARIHLPPLRERKEDIPYLLAHFLRELGHRFSRSVEGFTDETMAYLLHYDWPGNVRELKNLCEAIFINQPSRTIIFHDLPEPFQRLLREAESLPQDERDRLLSALLSTRWNISKAARKLHWSRMTIYRKIEKYHIKKPCMPDGATA